MVFVTANTNNDCLANVMRVNNQGNNGFDVMSQREEALADAPGVQETVAWVAIEKGFGAPAQVPDLYMDSLVLEDLSNDALEVPYPEKVKGKLPAAIFGQVASFNSEDTAWATYRDLNLEEVNEYVAEEKSFDEEVDFNEDVNVLIVWMDENK